MYWEQGTIFNSSSTQFQMMDIKLKEWDLILTNPWQIRVDDIDRRDESNVDEFYKLVALQISEIWALNHHFVGLEIRPLSSRITSSSAFKLGGAVAASMELEERAKEWLVILS